MNFDHFPILHFKYGFPLFWCFTFTFCLSILAIFKWKKWW